MRTTDFSTHESNASVTAELALAAQSPTHLTIAGRELLVTPRADGGVNVAEVLKRDAHGNLLDGTSRIIGAVTLQTQDSMVEYLRDFKAPGTRVFADISANAMVAVLDYHRGRTDALTGEATGAAAGVSPLADDAADHGQHTATLRLPFSEEWKVWTGTEGKLMSQTDFARFIIENQPDFVSPSHADLLELARDLRGSRNVKFTANVNPNAERESFEYVDRQDVNRTDNLDVPSGFTIRIPVYFGGEATELQAQLRHDVDESGRLKLGYKLLRAEQVRQAVFRKVVGELAEQAGVPALYGTVTTRAVDTTGVDHRL